MPHEPHPPATPQSAEAPTVTLRGYYEGRTPLKRLFSLVGSMPADAYDQAGMQALLVDLGGFDPDLRKTVRLASARANVPRWLQAWCKTVVEREMGDTLNPEEVSTGFGLRRLFIRCRESLPVKDANGRALSAGARQQGTPVSRDGGPSMSSGFRSSGYTAFGSSTRSISPKRLRVS